MYIPRSRVPFLPAHFFLFFILTWGQIFFSIAFRDREERRRRNINVRNINWLFLVRAWTRNGTHNLGMCPDQESHLQPISYGMTLQLTEPHQSGPLSPFLHLGQGEQPSLKPWNLQKPHCGRGRSSPRPPILIQNYKKCHSPIVGACWLSAAFPGSGDASAAH